MQRKYLGDALDFWKGSFLDVFRACCSPAHPLVVLPMFTDLGWSPAELDTYAALLHVSRTSLLSTARLQQSNRRAYFKACASLADDVFVDPDNGVAPGSPEPRHVSASEVFVMLSGLNAVAVYQHRPRGQPSSGWLSPYKQALVATGALVIGYESAQVGMLFATRCSVREAGIRGGFSGILGAVSAARGVLAPRLV